MLEKNNLMNCDKQVVPSKQIITGKYTNERKIVKARLATRSFQENLSQFVTNYSTQSQQSFRLLMVVAANNNFRTNSLDT